MRELFGTDGIRGVAGEFPLDPATISYIGLAVGRHLAKMGQNPRVILGRDTRESGPWISQCLVGSLRSAGVESIHEVDVISTPGIAYLTRDLGFDLGIMISASHNPYQDNGIKLFSRNGFKLPDELEKLIEKEIHSLIKNGKTSEILQDGKRSLPGRGALEDYVNFLVSQFHGRYSAGKLGLDVCNGSACWIAPQVFRRLGADVVIIHDSPDGRNINRECGSMHVKSLVRLVKNQKLGFGVAFDGDADRSLFVTPSGRVFDGDHVLYAFARSLKQENKLRQNTVVGTVMTNFALEKSLGKEGITLARAAVGDKYVLEEMRRRGANLGGEPSGHIILSDCHTTGDGILTAVKLAEILSLEHLNLDQLAEGFRPYPQVLEGLRVKRRIPLADSQEIQEILRRAEDELHGNGRLVVRYSGTELLLRLMAEGEDAEQVRSLVERLKADLGRVLSLISG